MFLDEPVGEQSASNRTEIKNVIRYMNIYEIFNNLRYHHEDEVVEFKKAENNFDFDDLGKYFSALSNEANLRDISVAWQISWYA